MRKIQKTVKSILNVYAYMFIAFFLLKIIYIVGLVVLKYPTPQASYDYFILFLDDLNIYIILLLFVFFTKNEKLILYSLLSFVTYVCMILCFDRVNILVEYDRWASRGIPVWGSLDDGVSLGNQMKNLTTGQP